MHVCNIYVKKATYIFGETMEERDMKINPQL